MTPMHPSIRFPQEGFRQLRAHLLEDLSQEAFGVLLGKRETVAGQVILKVLAARYPEAADYAGRSVAHLGLKQDFVARVLAEATQRLDVDTLIDVHTHPFCRSGVAFSGTDDRDEISFRRYLAEHFDLHYASIVLSRSDYAARLWEAGDGRPVARVADIRTQTVPEAWPAARRPVAPDDDLIALTDPEQGFLARGALALGLDTLRPIVRDQTVMVVGVGGLGSQIAENLVHMGFHHLHLVDPDVVEVTNLNRIVGAHRADARAGRAKAEVLRRHLTGINPQADIQAHVRDIHDPELEATAAQAHWLIAATDNQASRFRCQELALRYFVPLLSAGVNISVAEGVVTDMSGEVIVVRGGDGLCLNCLGRLNPIQVAAGQHPNAAVRNELVRRGYVQGQEVKEPAVKTLNATVSALAVDCLLNQYTQRQPHVPVLVFESNRYPLIYEDRDSLMRRDKQCFRCHL